MDSNNKSKNENNEINESNINLTNIKSNYILSKIFVNIKKILKFEIIKYNKKLQNRLNLNIDNYREYSEIFTPIEIEIIPIKIKNEYGKFININRNYKSNYHIYFNDNKEETKNKYEIEEEDKVKKIKIIIDHQVKSIEKLFKDCECIESIKFKKFYRNNFNSMSEMFYNCWELKEVTFSSFNTNNVTNMSYMFYGCASLIELNIHNINVNNLTSMRCMFDGCSEQFKIKIKTKYPNIKEEAFIIDKY